MARIISGFAGSLTLTVPPTGTRPTSDRVREALFSALDARDAIDGYSVLDLYAGTGSLGLEAASRGAAYVVLVEKTPAAAKICRSNAALIRGKAPKSSTLRIEVAGQAVQAFLDGDSSLWDLVFFDPPYELSNHELEQNLAALVPRLAEDAIVVIERASRDAAPVWPAGLQLDKAKTYGDTVLYWLQPA